jgi:nicotinamidase-related amidase
MKLALMVIDLQKAFYKGEALESMDNACEYINEMLPLFRKKGLPIIWVQHIEDENGIVPGTEGFEFIDCLKPAEGEYKIYKKYGNSFNKTKCAELLKENNIDTVIITGYCAEYCVLSTYRGALDLDLLPVILKNGIASSNKEGIKFVEDISNIISYGVLARVMEG